MKLIHFVMAMLLFVCLCSVALTQTAKNPGKGAEWEYTRVSNPDDRLFNLYAKQGWEVITAAGAGSNNSNSFYIYMKRHNSHPLFGIPFKYDYEIEEPTSSTCHLTLDKAPVIRGLRLNMTQEELFALFPGSDGEFEKKIALQRAESEGYGATNLEFSSTSYVTRDQFNGIERISVGIFDKRVTKIYLSYNFGKSGFDNAEQTIDLFSKQFNLPGAKDWGISGNKNNGKLVCRDFSINIHGSTVVLLGQSFDEKVKERRDAARAKLREGVKF